MKYAVYYSQLSNYHTSKPDEIIIKYTKNEGKIRDYCAEMPDSRIIIRVDSPDVNFIKLKAEIAECKKDNVNNFAITVPSYMFNIDADFFDFMETLGIEFFFIDLVDSWTQLYSVLQCGVSDIYVTNDLAFEIDKVAATAHSAGAKVRLVPNMVQRDAFNQIPILKSFFIRPNDIELYEDYVDIMELAVLTPYNIDQALNIYRKGKWFGDLRELILNFNDSLDCRYVVDQFGKTRLSCGHRCLKGKQCHMCDTIQSLSHSLEKVNLAVLPKKEKKNEEIS